jgi:hypothetical protein
LTGQRKNRPDRPASKCEVLHESHFCDTGKLKGRPGLDAVVGQPSRPGTELALNQSFTDRSFAVVR